MAWTKQARDAAAAARRKFKESTQSTPKRRAITADWLNKRDAMIREITRLTPKQIKGLHEQGARIARKRRKIF